MADEIHDISPNMRQVYLRFKRWQSSPARRVSISPATGREHFIGKVMAVRPYGRGVPLPVRSRVHFCP